MAIRIGSIVKLYTILLLSEHPKHGYELMRELQERLGRKVSPSQVYPFLNTLERHGIIKVEKRGKRDKKVYCLTKKGRKFVARTLTRFGELVELAIEPKLKVCAHCGCKVYEGAHIEKIGNHMLTFCCHHCAESFKAQRTN
jgi:DNA-binding PadR family transcriptional regulator